MEMNPTVWKKIVKQRYPKVIGKSTLKSFGFSKPSPRLLNGEKSIARTTMFVLIK